MFGYCGDADHYAREVTLRALQRPAFSKWDKLREKGCRKSNCGGRYLSDFITDGPLSDSTIEDILRR